MTITEERLIKLEKYCKGSVLDNPPTEERLFFWKELAKVQVELNAEDDTTTLLRVGNCGLRLAEFIIENSTAPPTFYLDDLDNVIGFLTRTKVVGSISGIADNSNTLAAIAVLRTHLANKGNPHPHRDNLSELIYQWTEQLVNRETLKSTYKMIDFLYGPAVNTLYSNEVSEELFLPKYLYEQRPPIVISATKTEVLYNGTDAPFDIA